MWRENVLAHVHLWREELISNTRVTRWHNKYKILNYIETQLLFRRFAYQVQPDYITVV